MERAKGFPGSVLSDLKAILRSFWCTDAFSGAGVLRLRSSEQQELAPSLTSHARNEKFGDPPTGKDEEGPARGSLSCSSDESENITEPLFHAVLLHICYSSL